MQTTYEKAESRRYYARFITSFFFIAAIIGIFLGIELYRNTVIHPYILLALVVPGAFIGFFFFWKQSLLVTTRLLAAFNCCITGGGLFYYFFLMLNYQFANPEILSFDCDIIKTGTLGRGAKSRCRAPYFVVNFMGKEKELVFKCNLEYPIEQYKSVYVSYQKGLFGFEYIVEKYPLVN